MVQFGAGLRCPSEKDDSMKSIARVGKAANELGRPQQVGVLYIIDQLCRLGGAERILLRMIERLPRERYLPHLVTFKVAAGLGITDSLSCPLSTYALRRTYDRTAVETARKIRRLIRTQGIQITHTFHETSDLWAGPIAKLSGCPVLISSRRDMGFLRHRKHQVGYRWLRPCFDQVHTVSEQVRNFCINQDGLDPERVVTVYNGVNLPSDRTNSDRYAIKKRFGLDRHKRLVLSVGNIRPVKGFDVFVEAAAHIARAAPDTAFAIAGEDSDTECCRQLREMASARGLKDNFFLLGGLDDVYPLLQAADVFCLLSRTEGLSNALLEAMACELPCVATAVGGNPEVVVPEKSGFLVQNEDFESAAQRVIELLEKPGRAQSMGAYGRRVIEDRFTTEVMMRRLTDSYEHLLSVARSKKS